MDAKHVWGVIAFAAVTVSAGAAGISYVEAPKIEVPRLESVAGGLDVRFLTGDRVLLSGGFAWVNAAAHSGLVRLNAGGSVDPAYRAEVLPGPEYFGARSFVAQSDGTVYLLAEHSSGQRDRLWRLRPDGSRDSGYEQRAAWATALPELGDPYLTAIATGAGGRMLVWGSFGRFGGVEARDVALVNADGSVNPSFSWRLPIALRTALPLADGRWIVLGALEFGVPAPGVPENTVPRDVPRVVIVRVSADGSLDPTFRTSVFAHSLSSGPHALALDDRGRIVFAETASLSPRYRLRLGRLLTDGRRDGSFAPTLPDLADPALPYAALESPGAEPAGGAESLIYTPPTVRRIVAAGNGAVMCFADWEDRARRGVVGVADDGDFDARIVPYKGAGFVRWLRRDSAGRWWGEFATLNAAPPVVGLARLSGDGLLDPTFTVKATALGHLSEVVALPDGAVAVRGWFDLAGGKANPGLVILESDGRIRDNRAPGSLPWGRAEIVAALGDGSILAQEERRFIIASTDAIGTLAGTPAVRLGRLFPNGSWQTLVSGEPEYFFAANGWLDADGRVVVHVPGDAIASEGANRSDLWRFFSDGSRDTTYRAVDERGVAIALGTAAPTDDGRGAWATSRDSKLLRLDSSGRLTKTIPLRPSYGIATIAATPGWAVIGGNFQRINEIPSPGFARVLDDGRVDDTWGGWLRPGSTVYVARTLGNGLISAVGFLKTPLGDRSALLFRPDGLPLLDQPEFAFGGAVSALRLVSPAGDWIAQLERNDSATGGAVKRWRSVAAPEVHIVPSKTGARPGEEITLDLDWAGLLPLGIVWFRDGVALDPQPGFRFKFVVRAEDDGAVFSAFVLLEGGGGYFTLAWRLDVSGRHVRLSNASIRALAGPGDDRLILGAVFEGSNAGRILTRALGPALGELGISGHAGPLTSALLRPGGNVFAPPEDYRLARDLSGVSHPDVIAAARAMGAHHPDFNRASGNDQMIYENVAGGAYHFHVTPQLATSAGIVLAELFALDRSGGIARPGVGVRNFSGRAPLRPGDGVLIGGFVVEGDRPMRLLLRGVGPGLTGYGVLNAAANPQLAIHAGAAVLESNDDWSAIVANRDAVEAAQAATGAFALTRDSRDAAIVAELAPGVYTVVVRSDEPADVGRVALVEIYALD